jgi:chromosome segregation ATPase
MELIDEKVQAIDVELQKVTDTKAELQDRMENAKIHLAPLKDRVSGIKHQQRDITNVLNETTQELQAIANNMQDTDKKIREFQERIDTENQKLSGDHRELNRIRETKITALENKKEGLIRSMDEISQRMDELQNQMSETDQLKRRQEHHLQDIGNECKGIQDRIRQVNSQKQNSLLAYGREMPNVVKAIDEYDKRNMWKGAKPIGPFGKFVKLENRKYKDVVETILNKMLNSFGVDNSEDFQTLKKIFRDNRW